MKTSTISLVSKIALLASSALLLGSIMFPMWQIELQAPQYPEGLVLKLYANKIGGDVEIINGLNHYIGMKTLHTENFPEFTFLPYVVGFFGLAALLMVFWSNRKAVVGLLVAFVTFGVLAAVDFYRWNYNYGHDLDPNAAIKVPGMAYQPPLLGYKQLLNFGAYSIPDTGGFMLILAGLLLAIVALKETNFIKKLKTKNTAIASVFLLLLSLISCNNSEPETIKLNTDACDFCKMTISNGKFGAEVLTQKGRYYKFDDVACMIQYTKENTNTNYTAYYVCDYEKDNQLIDATKSFYLKGENIASPMGGNIAAFTSQQLADNYKPKLNAESVTWNQILNAY